MPLFRRRPHYHDPVHSSTLAHDTHGRLHGGNDPISHIMPTVHHPSYFDPSFRYDYGDERYISGHPHDIRDPYLRSHLRQIRRAAKHGELSPNDPAFAPIVGDPHEPYDIFNPEYMGRDPSRLGGNSHSFHGKHHVPRSRSHRWHTTSAIEEENVSRRHSYIPHRSISERKLRRSASVPSRSHRQSIERPPDVPVASIDKIREYGRPIDSNYIPTTTGTSNQESQLGQASKEQEEVIAFHPKMGAGTIECQHGAELALAPKQTLPYRDNAGGEFARSGIVSSSGRGTDFHPQSLTAANLPHHSPLSRVESTAPESKLRPPGTTIDAIDRANRIALAEQESNRRLSYTKVGPVTFTHHPSRSIENQMRVQSLRRSYALGGLEHTTTEKAILRANALASMEISREREGRQGITRVGRWVI